MPFLMAESMRAQPVGSDGEPGAAVLRGIPQRLHLKDRIALQIAHLVEDHQRLLESRIQCIDHGVVEFVVSLDHIDTQLPGDGAQQFAPCLALGAVYVDHIAVRALVDLRCEGLADTGPVDEDRAQTASWQAPNCWVTYS